MENRYKSVRIIDGKVRSVIVNEEGKVINRNPGKYKLKDLEKEPYSHARKKHNDTETCDRCGISFNSYSGHPVREYDKYGDFVGWDCHSCCQKFDPNSQRNIEKSLRDRRTGLLDPNSQYAFGDDGEELTSEVFEIDNLNKKLDSYGSSTPIDHSCHPVLGVLQTKIRYLDKYGRWSFGYRETEYEKDYNNSIFWCTNKYRDIIERLYIYPKNVSDTKRGITIVKNPTNNVGIPIISIHEKYRIYDEEIFKKANEKWKEIRRRRIIRR